MKGYSKGHDPDLGRKFEQESSGFVIGRARSSKKASEKPLMPAGLDAQQQHDWLMDQVELQSVAVNEDPSRPETEEDGVALGSQRVARWKHQNGQLHKKG